MAKELHFYNRGPDRPWVNRSLTNAAIIGHTTIDSARIWIRVWKAGDYLVLISEKPLQASEAIDQARSLAAASTDGEFAIAGRDMACVKENFRAENDFTCVIAFTGLKPGTEYYYCVLSEQDREDLWEMRPQPEYRKFRTQKTSPAQLAFAIFSCHMPFAKNGDIVNVQMWDRLADELQRHNADFIIGAGDQVYTDGNKDVSIWQWLKTIKKRLLTEVDSREARIDVMRSWYRDIYRGYWGFRNLQRILGQYPTYMIWDDHDIMDGWGSYTEQELGNQLDSVFEWENTKQNVMLAMEMFEAAKLTYFEYQHSHNPPTGKDVFDYSYEWGGCSFYVLDMRGHRDFNRASSRVLGDAQRKRFEGWIHSLEEKPCRAAFVVSPVPVVHLANFVVNYLDLPAVGLADDLRDEWAHESNWEERNWLFDLVFNFSERTRKRAVFLSGDVHIGAAFRLAREKQAAARVYQLTSSGITHPMTPLLKLTIQGTGYVEGYEPTKPDSKTAYQMLHSPFARNNFGMVSVRNDGKGDVDIGWELYGGTGQEDEVVRLKELHLE